MKKSAFYLIILSITLIFSQIASASDNEPATVVLNYVQAYSEKNVDLILNSLHPDFFAYAKNRFISKYEKYPEQNKRHVRSLFKVTSNAEFLGLKGREFYKRLLLHSGSDKYWKNFDRANLKLESIKVTEKTENTATVTLPVVGEVNKTKRTGITVFRLSKSKGSWLIKSLNKR